LKRALLRIYPLKILFSFFRFADENQVLESFTEENPTYTYISKLCIKLGIYLKNIQLLRKQNFCCKSFKTRRLATWQSSSLFMIFA